MSSKGLSDNAAAVTSKSGSHKSDMFNSNASLACCSRHRSATTHQGPVRCSSAGQLVDTVTSLGPQGCLEMRMPSRSSACIPSQDSESVLALRSAENLHSTVAKIEPSTLLGIDQPDRTT